MNNSTESSIGQQGTNKPINGMSNSTQNNSVVNMETDKSVSANASHAQNLVQTLSFTKRIGKVVRLFGSTVYVSGLSVSIGQRCEISRIDSTSPIFADVIGIAQSHSILQLLGDSDGISTDSEVTVSNQGRSIVVNENMLGTIMDGSGQVLQAPKQASPKIKLKLSNVSPDFLNRKPIDQVFETGIRVIDSFMTVGQGQRLGIFAAPGVGKSTLLSMIARNASADVIVIGLIGERGREVNEFISNNLGAEGVAKSVIVVSTSDRPALERIAAAETATAIAEEYRRRGMNVVLLLDSLTRYARALREIGLSMGEPAIRRGFTPSVFSALPKLLERAGNDAYGSITAFYTVLTEDEDSNDPIAEEVKSIVDGHIVLSSEQATRGVYPAIDVLSSNSRLFQELTTDTHKADAYHCRACMSLYADTELLIQMGEYQQGTDEKTDAAIKKQPYLEEFCKQKLDEVSQYTVTMEYLNHIANKV